MTFIAEPLPMLTDGLFAWRFRIESDLDGTANSERSSALQNKVGGIAREMKIDKEIVVKRSFTGLAAHAHGNSLLPGRAGIIISPFYDSNVFIIKHELAHIKNNDLLIMPSVSIVAGVIAGIASAYFFPQVIVGGIIVSRLVGAITAWVTLPLIMQRRERVADETALSYCTPEEKQAGFDFMENQRRSQIEYRNQEAGWIGMLWKKLIISPEGNVRYDIFHPSLSDRCEYITASIHKQD